MKYSLILSALLVLSVQCFSSQENQTFNVVGWYVGTNTAAFPPSELRWDIYSHITLNEAPIITEEGFTSCNKSDPFFNEFMTLAKQNGKKIVWRPAINVWQTISNASWATYEQNFIASIGQAVRDCGVSGIEIDYECPPTAAGRAGIVTKQEALDYTKFLVNIQKSMGPGYEVSADVGVWGVTDGSYPLDLEPWLNIDLVKATENLYVNSMSYHQNALCSIFQWKKDGWFLNEILGFPKDRINIGIGYFSFNGKQEPAWGSLSEQCPNISPEKCQCGGVGFASKDMNYEIGQWVKEEGYRGVFPWAANYDALDNNNTLIPYLGRGLGIIE